MLEMLLYDSDEVIATVPHAMSVTGTTVSMGMRRMLARTRPFESYLIFEGLAPSL